MLLFLARSVGLLNAPQLVLVTTIETEDPRDIAGGVASSILDAAAKGVAPRHGLATRRLARGKTRLVLLVQDTPYELVPLPRQLPPGGTATLSGKLLGAYQRPSVVVSDASGHASEPAQGEGAEFKADLRCGDRPGQLRIELRATLDGQLRRLATIPVACGGPPPSTSFPLEEQPWPADPAAQARLVFDQINAERAGAGIAPVAWEPTLAAVAQELTVDLADEQQKGAVPAHTVTERLAKVDMGSPLVLQNPGQSTSAKRVAEGFLDSPLHRANLMNPGVNSGAVGVVQRTGPDGKPLVFLTELLTSVLPPLDPVKVRQEVRAALVARRVASKVAPVTSDPYLEKAAQAYAEALAAAGGNLSDARSEELTQEVARRYKAINLVPGAKADPMDFASEPTLLGKVGKGLGVGAARGKHPVLGKSTVYIAVITATKL